MHDIFLSYASVDRDKARRVAEALAGRGWSVWWDRDIPPGKSFDQVIEEAIEGARCVVVIWTRGSVESHWVKTEASEGLQRRVLVPVLADEVKIPLEFRRIQAASLVAWDGSQAHPEFAKLCASIEAVMGAPAPAAPKPAAAAPRRRWISALVVAGVAAVVCFILYGTVRIRAMQRVLVERKTKVNLTNMRSTLLSYYAERDKSKPFEMMSYFKLLPTAIPAEAPPYHGPWSSIESFAPGKVPDDRGGWAYLKPNGEGAGEFVVNCTHTDSAGKIWSQY